MGGGGRRWEVLRGGVGISGVSWVGDVFFFLLGEGVGRVKEGGKGREGVGEGGGEGRERERERRRGS